MLMQCNDQKFEWLSEGYGGDYWYPDEQCCHHKTVGEFRSAASSCQLANILTIKDSRSIWVWRLLQHSCDQFHCSYHLVAYDVWHKKQEEKNLKLPEICYSGCIYEREGSNPGAHGPKLSFVSKLRQDVLIQAQLCSDQQMTGTASRREGRK